MCCSAGHGEADCCRSLARKWIHADIMWGHGFVHYKERGQEKSQNGKLWDLTVYDDTAENMRPDRSKATKQKAIVCSPIKLLVS